MTKDEIENIKWTKRSRGYGLKFITKSDTSLRYDGFKDTVRTLFNRGKFYDIKLAFIYRILND